MITTVDIIMFLVMLNFSYFTFFHLILWAKSKNALRKINASGQLPAVSILVPAYNEEGLIEDSIKNLLGINYPKDMFEIIVIDDGSKDNTYKVAKKFESQNVKVLTKKNTGKASALNFGLSHAKYDFVAVCDADTAVDENALRNCMRCFDKEDVAAVTSHILVKNRKTVWGRLQNIELMIISIMRKAQEQMNIISATPGPLSVYKKKVLSDLGGFDEKNLIEDVEIAWRIIRNGYKIRVAFDAYAYSIYPDNLKKWWDQRLRWGIGGIQTTLKYINTVFDKKTFGVGNFLVPTSIVGYSASFVWVVLLAYLLVSSIFNYSSFIVDAFEHGINPFKRLDISLDVDVKLIYGVAFFLLSLVVLKFVLSAHKEKTSVKDIILFLCIYPFLFPAVNLYSFYKFLTKERGWLTK